MSKTALISGLISSAVLSCSQPQPPPLSEAELVSLLAKADQQGPAAFRTQTWPTLENKPIVYCGTADRVGVVQNSSIVTLQVKQIGSGQELPWTLEGKTNSADFASSHKAGDPVCIQGVLSGFTAREHRSWAYRYWGIVEQAAFTIPSSS